MKCTPFFKICITIASILLITTDSYAAVAATATQVPGSSSSLYPPTTKQAKIKCHQFSINNQTLTKNNRYIHLGVNDCQSYSGGMGGIAMAFGGIGGQLNPNCRNKSGGARPYLQGYGEGGGGTMFSGGINMAYIICCSKPTPPVKLTSDASDTSYWANSPTPDCP